MEQNQEETNEPLKQPANQFETAEEAVEIESPPPQDKNDILYIVLIAIGICFALPFYRYFRCFKVFIDFFSLIKSKFQFQLLHVISLLAASFCRNAKF